MKEESLVIPKDKTIISTKLKIDVFLHEIEKRRKLLDPSKFKKSKGGK